MIYQPTTNRPMCDCDDTYIDDIDLSAEEEDDYRQAMADLAAETRRD